jgi:hypothetical protein
MPLIHPGDQYIEFEIDIERFIADIYVFNKKDLFRFAVAAINKHFIVEIELMASNVVNPGKLRENIPAVITTINSVYVA